MKYHLKQFDATSSYYRRMKYTESMISAYAQNGMQQYPSTQPNSLAANGCGSQSLRRQHHYMNTPQGKYYSKYIHLSNLQTNICTYRAPVHRLGHIRIELRERVSL